MSDKKEPSLSDDARLVFESLTVSLRTRSSKERSFLTIPVLQTMDLGTFGSTSSRALRCFVSRYDDVRSRESSLSMPLSDLSVFREGDGDDA